MEKLGNAIFFESIEEASQEITRLKQKWEGIKSDKGHNFPEFVDDRFAVIKNIINSSMPNSNDYSVNVRNQLSLIKVSGEYNLLKNVFLNNNISLEDMFLFVKPNERINYFVKYADQLSDKKYWENLSRIYLYQKYNKIPYDIYRVLFKSNRPYRNHLMSEEEREAFRSFPEKITIYRAMSKEESQGQDFGFSWTLSKEVAEFFLDRNKKIFGADHLIHKLQINKFDTLAYLNSRNEEEIIYISE